jgi:hypothetical protein
MFSASSRAGTMTAIEGASFRELTEVGRGGNAPLWLNARRMSQKTDADQTIEIVSKYTKRSLVKRNAVAGGRCQGLGNRNWPAMFRPRAKRFPAAAQHPLRDTTSHSRFRGVYSRARAACL